MPSYFKGHQNDKNDTKNSITMKGQEVHKCNTIGLSSLCIAPVIVLTVKSGERADVPKVELGEQRVNRNPL